MIYHFILTKVKSKGFSRSLTLAIITASVTLVGITLKGASRQSYVFDVNASENVQLEDTMTINSDSAWVSLRQCISGILTNDVNGRKFLELIESNNIYVKYADRLYMFRNNDSGPVIPVSDSDIRSGYVLYFCDENLKSSSKEFVLAEFKNGALCGRHILVHLTCTDNGWIVKSLNLRHVKYFNIDYEELDKGLKRHSPSK